MAWTIGSYELDEVVREVRHDGQPCAVEPKVIDLLEVLIRNRERLVSKEELINLVWGGRAVSDSAISSCIKAARQALGDDGKTQRIIKTTHGRGFRFVGTIESTTPTVDSPAANAPLNPIDLAIRFAGAPDGFQSAIGIVGSGATLIKTANWLSHVELDTESPVWRHWVQDLGRQFRYVRYDARGSGLSDRDLSTTELSNLDTWIDDLVAVADTVGAERFFLLGVSQGSPVAIAFAHRFPERVAGMILVGSYARGMKKRDDVVQFETAELQVDLARIGWGSDNDTFRQVFAEQFVPDAGPEERAWFTTLLRETTNADNAPLLESAFHEIDVSHLARELSVPVLVVHAKGDRVVPFAEGRRLAGLIPNARFVPLESDNHILDASNTVWTRFMVEVERFKSEFAGRVSA